ncbi:MAG: ParA family partition ATPase [Acetobacteraceae bacterium]
MMSSCLLVRLLADMLASMVNGVRETQHTGAYAMKIIGIASQKGGVGKSTLAVHLAAEAAAKGHKTLVIDLDPQGSAMEWANRRGEREPDVSGANPASLAKEIATAQEEGYDLVILDTAPHADHAALQAARVADLVLVPCRPSTFDIAAISATLDLCKLAKRQAEVVLNAAPIRSKVTAEAREAIVEKGGIVSPVVIHHRVAFQHCMIDGRTAAEYEPGGPASQEIASLLAHLQASKHESGHTGAQTQEKAI